MTVAQKKNGKKKWSSGHLLEVLLSERPRPKDLHPHKGAILVPSRVDLRRRMQRNSPCIIWYQRTSEYDNIFETEYCNSRLSRADFLCLDSDAHLSGRRHDTSKGGAAQCVQTCADIYTDTSWHGYTHADRISDPSAGFSAYV